MKWLQLDADFFNKASIRRIAARHGNAGPIVILRVWTRTASCIEKTDVSCRLPDPIDLVAIDCNVPVDKVASIFNTAYELVYENIGNVPYHVLDIDPVTKIPGCNLLLYKLDNTTSDSPFIRNLKNARANFKRDRELGKYLEDPSKTLPSALEETSGTDIQTDIHTHIQRGAHGKAPSSGQLIDPISLMREHINNNHVGKNVDGCPNCAQENKREVAG